MMPNLWTQDEVDLLYENLSDKQISEMTGRTREAVRKKRYQLFGHYVETTKWMDKRVIPHGTDDAIIKEVRLLNMAKQMRVKLLG